MPTRSKMSGKSLYAPAPPHLDEETYNYYQRRAAEKHADSIEEQIKSELRSFAEKEAA